MFPIKIKQKAENNNERVKQLKTQQAEKIKKTRLENNKNSN